MPVHNLPYSLQLAGETFELPSRLDNIGEVLSAYVLYSEYEAEISDSLELIGEGLNQLPDEHHPFLAVLRTRHYNVEQRLGRGLRLDEAISDTLATGSMTRAQMVTAYGIITAEIALSRLANWIYTLENDLFEEEKKFPINGVKLTDSKRDDPEVYAQFIHECREKRFREEIEAVSGSATYQGRARYLYLMARVYDSLTEDEKVAEALLLGAAQRDKETKETSAEGGSKTPYHLVWAKEWVIENFVKHAFDENGVRRKRTPLSEHLKDNPLPKALEDKKKLNTRDASSFGMPSSKSISRWLKELDYDDLN